MKSKLISIICVIMLALSLSSITVLAADEVVIDENTFPDDTFRNYVAEFIDSDKNGVLSTYELTSVTSISYIDSDIADLTGVEHFTALSYLNVNNNQLSELDLSNNIALTALYASNNQLSELDLSKNSDLVQLYLDNNKLTKLDLSQNTKLINVLLNDELQPQLAGMLYYVKSDDNFVVNLGAQLGLNATELANIKLADGQGATFDATTGKVTFTSAPTMLNYTYATGAVRASEGIVFHTDMDVIFTVERDPNDKDPNPETPDPETPTPVETVAITGRLVDANGNPIANVVVAMFSEPIFTFTDANGYYKLENVPVGTHILRVFSTQSDFEAYVADLNAGTTPSVKPLVEITNVIVSKDASGNAIVNIDGKLYNDGNFFVQINANGTVGLTTTNPKTSDSNNVMVFVLLLAVSTVGLIVVILKKLKSK